MSVLLCDCPLCEWHIDGIDAKDLLRRFDDHVREKHGVDQTSYVEDEQPA